MKSDSFPHNLLRKEKYAVFVLIGIAAIIVFGSLFGLIVQYLWNATLMPLLNVGEISFWQAIGVLILAKLFFGFGSSGGPPGRSKRKKKSRWSGEANDEDLMKEQAFREYWEREGKSAYEAYKSTRDNRDDLDDANQ